MSCLKTTVFFSTIALICGAAALSHSAVPQAGTPQPQNRILYLQLAEIASQTHGRGILNGYKGYRHHRPGYKRHTDRWWYPQAAFETTAVPEIDNKTVKTKAALPARHISWCRERYRSYRVEDNTVQPYDGPRKACRSPYLKSH